MASHLNKQLRAQGLEGKVFLEFIPFANLYGDDSAFITKTNRERQDEVDVALLCPHLEFDAKRAVDAGKLHIPIFLLPMRLYGLVDVENLIEEAEDVLALWNDGTPNIVTFPDEPRSIMARRTVSHRRWIARQGVK
jgi:PTS system cellobiose-specific IIB component